MGPELPQDPGEDQLPIPTVQQQPIAISDDNESDNETNSHDGYHPLAMDEADAAAYQQQNAPDAMSIADDDDDGSRGDADIDLMQEQVTHGDPNIPQIESADAEIERQIWNEPRPRELQIELDNTRTEQIMTAMAGFTLPNIAVPDWAAGVPEERWKDELLQRIRQRKEPKVTNGSVSANATQK